MGALAPPRSSWRPEDDVLLRKAVEDGASLESLAKGAVKFSRKFTFEQIQERWRSLLYDPAISVEAALCMMEFDHLTTSFWPKQKRLREDGESDDYAVKKKLQSVRSRFYTLKRRILTESPHCIDFDFLVTSGELANNELGEPGLGTHGVQYSDPGQFELDESDLDLLRHGFTEVVDDRIVSELSHSFDDATQGLLHDHTNYFAEPCNGIAKITPSNNIGSEMEKLQVKEICSAFYGNEDFTLPFLDNGSSCHDFQSLEASGVPRWSSSHGEINLVREPNVCAESNDIFMSELSELSSSLFNFTNDEELLLLGDRNDAISTEHLEALLFSSPNDTSQEERMDCSSVIDIATTSQFLSDEGYSCVLNTEDMEIPCNDDIVFFTERASSMISSLLKVEVGQHHGDDLSVAYEMDGSSKPGSEALTSSIFHNDSSEIYPRLHHDVNESGGMYNHVASWRTNTHVHTMVVEESTIESDDDVPHYADVEAMVLDMDLDSSDHRLFSSKEAFLYQLEDTKKLIIRLEQVAHSSMQRSIAFHGAFAILYGRHSKHYIKKSEVVLGRRAEGVKVDIDLGMEGPSCKISRRQAVINLDKSGVFRIKNLGKRRIGVNDTLIANGETICLPCSCLIEVRGVSFIFETYQRLVQQYLDSRTRQTHSRGHIVKHVVKLR